jgi:hypothetical protein
MTKYKMIYVRWTDSALSPEWMEIDKEAGTLYVESIGYLVFECEDHIEIAENLTHTHKGGVMAIPKSVIIEIKNLKVKK